MSFGGLILTNNGRNKMAAAISEKDALKFTHIQLGDEIFNGSYSSKTELSHMVMEIPISRVRRKDNEVLIECDWNSKQAPTAFYLREIGIIGNGVLCYYDNARDGDAEYIDPESEEVAKQKRFRFTISVTDDAEITTMISSGLYALAEEVEQSLSNLDEIKIGKTGDASNVIVNFTEAKNREKISSGETLKIMLGKIGKFFSDLKSVAFSGSYNDLLNKPTIPTASATMPKANGTAAVGSENKYARGDHTHPLQTSVSGSSGSCTGNAATATKATQDGDGNTISSTYLKKSGGTMTGSLNMGSNPIAFLGTRVIKSTYANGIEFYRTDGSGTGYTMWINDGGNDNFTPRSNGGSSLGSSSARWGQIYSTNSAISTSDRNMKHDISYIGQSSNNNISMTDDQLEDYIMGLVPCIYRLNDGTSGRPHHGFIAQDVEELMKNIRLDDHAGFIKSPKTRDVEIEKEIEAEEEDPDTGEVKIVKKVVKELQHEEIPGEYIYSLRYEEFIADIIRFVQIQKIRVDGLEKRLALSEQKNLELEKRVEALENLLTR